MSPIDQPSTVLALDTSSPVTSVALAIAGSVVEQRSVSQKESSKALLPMIDEVVSAAGVPLDELDGLVAFQGPGSFTGLRIGLATAMGLHQALGIPATAVPTLQVLAATVEQTAVPPSPGSQPSPPRVVLAAVDARRGAWYIQRYVLAPTSPSLSDRPSASGAPSSPKVLPTPIGEPAWISASDLSAGAFLAPEDPPGTVVSMAVEGLRDAAPWPSGTELLEAGALAGAAALLASVLPQPWDAATLTRPLYLSAPSVNRQKP